MKNITLAMIGIFLLMFAVTAFAVDSIQNKAMLSNQTTTGVSSVVNTGLHSKKTVVINGVADAAWLTAGTYGNYSGTVVIQGAPTATGPWVTLKDKAGNATSATTNTTFDLDNLVQYIRASYTKSKHSVSVWLYYAK